ncbi:hypothetical protein [Iodidimonas sp. SYSU 1G8]|uniref:hypothetical protein n=1 Tax=Iodidimonas sp. SYSU 1G8 TaxID=3133967 RepID=UPI0031FE7430
MDGRSLAVEQTGASTGHCDCCGSTTRRVWGEVHAADGIVAVYYVGWSEGRPDHGAAFDLIIGKWGDGATSEDRAAVSLDFRVSEARGAFMVVDAPGRRIAVSELAGSALTRSEVIGTPLASQVFALIDAVYMKDARLDEVRAWNA